MNHAWIFSFFFFPFVFFLLTVFPIIYGMRVPSVVSSECSCFFKIFFIFPQCWRRDYLWFSFVCVCVSKYVCMSFYHLCPEVQIKLLLYYQKVFFFSCLLKVFHPCKFSGFSWNKFSVFWNPDMIFKQLPKYKHFRKKRWYFMIFVYYGKPTKIFSMQVASEWVIDK